MKKALLQWNGRLLANAFGFTLFLAGYGIGIYRAGNEFPPRTGEWFLVYPAVFWVLWMISISLRKKEVPVIGYCVMAAASLVGGCLVTSPVFMADFKGSLRAGVSMTFDIAVLAFCVLIAISYFACAVITRREHREAA